MDYGSVDVGKMKVHVTIKLIPQAQTTSNSEQKLSKEINKYNGKFNTATSSASSSVKVIKADSDEAEGISHFYTFMTRLIPTILCGVVISFIEF